MLLVYEVNKINAAFAGMTERNSKSEANSKSREKGKSPRDFFLLISRDNGGKDHQRGS